VGGHFKKKTTPKKKKKKKKNQKTHPPKKKKKKKKKIVAFLQFAYKLHSTGWRMGTDRKNYAPDSRNISTQYGCQHVFFSS